MSLRLPAELLVLPSASSRTGALPKFEHGDLLSGKVTRIDPDGTARIRLADIDVRARGGGLLRAGQRVLVQVQKTRDEALLSLLPSIREGEILEGTAVRLVGSRVLARFGRLELIVRSAGAETSTIPPGAPVHAQVQLPPGRPVLQTLPGAAPGAIYGGTVVAERGDGSALVDIGGTSLIVEAARPVAIGELVQVRLSHVGDKWILQMLQQGDPALDSVENAALQPGSGERIGQLTASLLAEPRYARLVEALAAGQLRIGDISRELLPLLLLHLAQGEKQLAWISGLVRSLESILLNPQGGNLSQQMAGAMENSGIFMESRLLRAALAGKAGGGVSGDLKLALLLAAQKLSQMPHHGGAGGNRAPADFSGIAGRVGQLLDTITAEQFHNLRMIPSNEIYIQLPFTRDSGVESVEIRISPREKRTSRKMDARNILLTLAVVTSNLGRVKAALAIADGQVSCQVRAERDSVVELLKANAGLLKEGLEKLNYRVACIDCVLTKGESDLSLFDKAPAHTQKGLDVRA